MSDPELKMSDWAQAARHTRGVRRLWVATGTAKTDAPVYLLVFAGSQAQALAFAEAWDRGFYRWSVSEPNLGTGPDMIRPVDYGDTGQYIGIWQAPDALWAALGFEPSDDWRWCDGCDRVVHEDDWQEDADKCDACQCDL